MKHRVMMFFSSLLGIFTSSPSMANPRIEPSFDPKPDATGLSVFGVPRRPLNKPARSTMFVSPAQQLMSDLGNAKVNGRPLAQAETSQIQAEIMQAAADRRRRRALRT